MIIFYTELIIRNIRNILVPQVYLSCHYIFAISPHFDVYLSFLYIIDNPLCNNYIFTLKMEIRFLSNLICRWIPQHGSYFRYFKEFFCLTNFMYLRHSRESEKRVFILNISYFILYVLFMRI